MFSAKTIRYISFFGITLLLVLQYTWLKNSYSLMELDIMNKCRASLQACGEKHIYERFSSIKRPENTSSKDTIVQRTISEAGEMNTQLQELLIMLGKPTSIPRLDTLFSEVLVKELGFRPSYTMSIVNDSVKKAHELNKYTIYNKITDGQYVEVVLKAPLRSILRQAQYIVIVSLFLVVLIGVILVIQLKGMLRENRFVSFIKDYTHALTHELKTPISGIYMSSSMLASGKLEDKPDSRKLHYNICQEQSSKLLKTVERILLVAKAEHAAIEPNLEEVDMLPFMEKIAATFRNSNFRQKKLTITTASETEAVKGLIDPVLMENVLSNLIDNAIKYSNDTIDILITCSQNKKSVRLSVKDTGFGMGEREIKHIFDNFERGDKVERKGIDGFGIGLNYVYKVIKAHKGQITVNSQEGKGSEFVIEIPN